MLWKQWREDCVSGNGPALKCRGVNVKCGQCRKPAKREMQGGQGGCGWVCQVGGTGVPRAVLSERWGQKEQSPREPSPTTCLFSVILTAASGLCRWGHWGVEP